MQGNFTSREVVELTGITPRQLQWWDERRIVRAARQGHRRLYSMEDLTEIAVICQLRDRGFSLQRVRKVIKFLQVEFDKRLAETVRSGSDYHLLTDGRNLYLETFGAADCGHPEKFTAADVSRVHQRRSAAGQGRGQSREEGQ